MMPEPLVHRPSRRTLLKLGGAALVASSLAACGKGGSSGAAPNRPLVVSGWPDDNKTMAKLVARYTQETGKEATYIESPADYPEMVAKYLNYMKAEYDGIDVYLLDDFSSGNFATAGWLEDMQPVLSDNLSDFSANTKALFDLAGYSRVPIFVGATAYYHRNDVFEGIGADGPPTTWDEQITMGQQLRERYPDKWPLEPMCSKDSGADALAVQLIWQGGGDPAVANDEGTKKALQYAYDLVYKYKIMPSKITSVGVTEMNPLVQRGEAIAWYWYEGSDDRYNAKDSGVADNWGFTAWPAGPGGPCGHLQSWGWSVPKFAPKREQALEFAKWATESAQIKDFMVDGLKLPPPLESLLQDKAVQEKVSFCKYLSTYADSLKWRPIDNRSPLEFNNTLGDMLTSVITQEKSVDEAADWCHGELQKLA